MSLNGAMARAKDLLHSGGRRLGHAFARNPIVAHWGRIGFARDNFGDKLNPVLISALARRPVFAAADLGKRAQGDVLFAIGSMLASAGPNATVWGTGFIAEADRASRPGRITAVRGPMSRAKLLAAGILCPEVYGDPALLLPAFYPPRTGIRRGVGFIPHVRELDLPMVGEIALRPGVTVIDITGSIEAVVDAVTSCEMVLSSSLHGLICAHAYGVPARWVQLSGRPLGDGFKFRDYLASVQLGGVGAVPVSSVEDFDDAVARGTPQPAAIDVRPLVAACPIIDDVRKGEILALLPQHLVGARPERVPATTVG